MKGTKTLPGKVSIKRKEEDIIGKKLAFFSIRKKAGEYPNVSTKQKLSRFIFQKKPWRCMMEGK